MAAISITSAAIRPIGNVLVFIATQKVHRTFFPYPLSSTVHAARVSMAFQANARKSNNQSSWGTYIAGYLVMAWGGTIVSHFLLSIPPPPLYSVHPYLNYILVHLLLTAVFKLFPSLLNLKILDTVFIPLDALIRTNSITSAVVLLSLPPRSPGVPSSMPQINPLLSSSPLFHFILGATASSGGGITAGTLGTWNSEWSMGTPPFLRRGVGWLSSIDIWGGGLVALIYSTLVTHSAFHFIFTHPAMRMLEVDAKPVFTQLEAKAVGAVVLCALFGIRVWRIHWTGNPGLAKIESKTKIQ